MLSVVGMAQNFETQMLEKVKLVNQKKEAVNWLKLSSEFEALSIEHPNRYEAKYYTALCLVFQAFNDQDASLKETKLKKAELMVDKAIEQNPKDAELYILKALYFQAIISVDPQNRGYAYSQKAETALAQAYQIDTKNPRYYFLKGQNVFYTPEQYGGGKANAQPFFEQAAQYFKQNKTSNSIEPAWSEDTNKKQLKACKS